MAFFNKHQWWIVFVVGASCMFSIFVFVLILTRDDEAADSATGGGSHYVRLSQGNKGVIIFVHGVLGDGTSTWTNPNTKAYWPDLLTQDRTFDNYNIYVYEFPSSLLEKSDTIDELTSDMMFRLEDAGVLGHEELIFLSHSMGGLVTRGLLVKHHELIEKTGFIYFFSTPTTGSELAPISALLSTNPQFHNMFPMGEEVNSYIEFVQSAWLDLPKKPLSFCAYEILDTNGIKTVTRQSTTNLCTEKLAPIPANHISIVKPANKTSLSYIVFKAAFVKAHKY